MRKRSLSKFQPSTRRGQDHPSGGASISRQSKSLASLVMAGTDTTLLPREVCKSNLRPGFAESAGGMSEAGSGRRATGRRAAPKPSPGGFYGVGRGWAQRGAEGLLLPPGPPGVVLMFLGPLPVLTFCGSLTWCLRFWGQLEQRVWGSGMEAGEGAWEEAAVLS